MAITLNPFTGNFDFTGEWVKIKKTLLASGSSTFDSIPLSDFVNVDYIINYKSQTTGESKKINFSVVNNNSTLSDTVYGRIGSNIKVSTSADVNAGNFELNLVNNETFNVDVSVTRIILS